MVGDTKLLLLIFEKLNTELLTYCSTDFDHENQKDFEEIKIALISS